jgi:hypothetical protein
MRGGKSAKGTKRRTRGRNQKRINHGSPRINADQKKKIEECRLKNAD